MSLEAASNEGLVVVLFVALLLIILCDLIRVGRLAKMPRQRVTRLIRLSSSLPAVLDSKGNPGNGGSYLSCCAMSLGSLVICSWVSIGVPRTCFPSRWTVSFL